MKKNWGKQFSQNLGEPVPPDYLGHQFSYEIVRSKKRSPGLGNLNMNMSMDKPMALNRTEGTRGPQMKNAKMKSKKMSPRLGNENKNMSVDKPIALHNAEGTRGPQVENVKK